jgi:HK97 family phage prohead protease
MGATAVQEKQQRRFVPTGIGLLSIEERADKSPVIRGYAAVFYNGTPETEFRLWPGMVERISKGAFDRALREGDDVRGLFNHDANLILGRTAAKPPTMRLFVDAKGLRYEIDPPDTQVARDLLIAIKRGDVTGSSFGFRIRAEKFIKPEKDSNEPVVRQIEDVELFDVSPVVFPAYEATQVEARDALAARAGLPPPPPEALPGKLPDGVEARLARLEADGKRPFFF